MMSREEAEGLVVQFEAAAIDFGIYGGCGELQSPGCLAVKVDRDRFRDQLITALCAEPNAALLEALRDARSALQSLPADALGMVRAKEGRYEWPIRDELVAKIDRAIAAAGEE